MVVLFPRTDGDRPAPREILIAINALEDGPGELPSTNHCGTKQSMKVPAYILSTMVECLLSTEAMHSFEEKFRAILQKFAIFLP